MAKSKVGHVLSITANVLVIAVASYVVLEPQGRLRATIRNIRDAAAQRRLISDEWTALTSVGPRLDSSIAPVSLVEFGDYQCLFCARLDRELTSLLHQNSAGGVVYRHLPLSGVHPAAEGAARAAICAEEQGRFLRMHRQLFTTDQWRRDHEWTREARAAGVPAERAFENCLGSERTAARLEVDVALARRLGINGTPALVHRGGVEMGIPPVEELRTIVKAGH